MTQTTLLKNGPLTIDESIDKSIDESIDRSQDGREIQLHGYGGIVKGISSRNSNWLPGNKRTTESLYVPMKFPTP
jgi:hypothetical protein